MDYTKIVLIAHKDSAKHYLFEAPDLWSLEEGDKVVCDSGYGEVSGKVLSAPIMVSQSDLDFIVKGMNASLPLRRVLGKYKYIDFTYEPEQFATATGESA